MVYDEKTDDWVPRYGMGSIKKIQDKHNWLMEEKPKHVEAGIDPFTYKKNEKKLDQEKQKLRELKNKLTGTGAAGNTNPLDHVLESKGGNQGLKKRPEGERENIRKRERKALMKSLTLA